MTTFGTAVAWHSLRNAGQQRVNYVGPSDEWSMRSCFILHMAIIAGAAGADDFLIGSELVGLTRICSGRPSFPGVDHLISLSVKFEQSCADHKDQLRSRLV